MAVRGCCEHCGLDLHMGGHGHCECECHRAVDIARQFRLLAEHHREAEHRGQALADELAKVATGDGDTSMHRQWLISDWNEHQWPDFEKVV